MATSRERSRQRLPAFLSSGFTRAYVLVVGLTLASRPSPTATGTQRPWTGRPARRSGTLPATQVHQRSPGALKLPRALASARRFPRAAASRARRHDRGDRRRPAPAQDIGRRLDAMDRLCSALRSGGTGGKGRPADAESRCRRGADATRDRGAAARGEPRLSRRHARLAPLAEGGARTRP